MFVDAARDGEVHVLRRERDEVAGPSRRMQREEPVGPPTDEDEVREVWAECLEDRRQFLKLGQAELHAWTSCARSRGSSTSLHR